MEKRDIMTKKVVIDTNILIDGLKFHIKKYHAACIANKVQLGEIIIVLDHDRKIQEEYRKNLGYLYETWFSTPGVKVDYATGKLNGQIEGDLIKLKFHEAEDHIFVSVAFNTDRIIITRDSDYGKSNNTRKDNKKALDYMENQLKMKILDAKEGYHFLK